MRNLKRALSLTLASVMLLGMMVIGSSAAQGYDDVAETDNVEAIEVLQAIEVMVGDERGFGPDRPVNRAEMAVVMALLLNLDYNYYVSTCPFGDVYDWARGPVGACYANGIVSGRGDGVYDPGATVTAVEAASMLMRALGYFRYQNDYEGNFQLSTVKKGSQIGLFDNVGSSATEPMTRNQVAQMVLNALQTGMAEPDGNTINLTTPDGSVFTGKVNYVNITSNKDFARAISSVRASSMGSANDSPIVELGEQLYSGKLKLSDTTDAFGRPARHWEFDGKDVGTYVKKELLRAEYSEKVTGKMLYDLITKPTIEDYKFTISVDGIECINENKADLADAYFTTGNLIRSNTEAVGETGNGVLTQVFVDPDEGDKGAVYISVINTYLAKANSDYNEKKDEVDFEVWSVEDLRNSRTSKVLVKNTDEKETLTVKGDDFDIAGVKDGDIVLVNVAEGEIKVIMDPEVVDETEISAFKNGDWINAGGTQYDYASAIQYDDEVLDIYDDYNMKDTIYRVFLDKYGYALGVEIIDANDQYVFVTGIDKNTHNLTNKTAEGNLIFTDGTMKTAKIDMKNSVAANGRDDLPIVSLLNTWCKYTVNSEGVYTLTEIANDKDSFERDDRGNLYTSDKTDKVGQGRNIDIADRKNANNNDDTNETRADDFMTLDTSHIYLNSVIPGYQTIYTNDDTVFLTVKVGEIRASEMYDTTPFTDWDANTGSDYVAAIDDVDSVTVGARNVNLKVWNAAKAFIEGVKNGDLTDNRIAAVNSAGDGVKNETNLRRVASGAYTLFSDKGYVIATVVVGEDDGSTTNFAYVTSSDAKQETWDKTDDEYTWTREVIIDGKLTDLTEKGNSRPAIRSMTQGNWYEVKYKADGTVKNVTNLSTNTITPAYPMPVQDFDSYPTGGSYSNGKYIRAISDYQPAVDENDTVLLWDNLTDVRYEVSAKGNTLQVETATLKNNGFSVSGDCKVVLIKDVYPTRGNVKYMDDIEEYDKTGKEALDQLIKDLNDNKAFVGFIGAVFKGKLATSIVVYDKTPTVVDEGNDTTNRSQITVDINASVKRVNEALLEYDTVIVDANATGWWTPTDSGDRSVLIPHNKTLWIKGNFNAVEQNVDVNLISGADKGTLKVDGTYTMNFGVTNMVNYDIDADRLSIVRASSSGTYANPVQIASTVVVNTMDIQNSTAGGQDQPEVVIKKGANVTVNGNVNVIPYDSGDTATAASNTWIRIDGNMTVNGKNATIGTSVQVNSLNSLRALYATIKGKLILNSGRALITQAEGGIYSKSPADVLVTPTTASPTIKEVTVGMTYQKVPATATNEDVGTPDEEKEALKNFGKTDGDSTLSDDINNNIFGEPTATKEATAVIDGVTTSGNLTELVKIATDGAVITLQSDVTLTGALEINKSITLALNGKTLKGTQSTNGSALVDITSGSVTIKGDNSRNSAITETSASTSATSERYAIYVRGGADLDISGVTVTGNGGIKFGYHGGSTTEAPSNVTITNCKVVSLNDGTEAHSYAAVNNNGLAKTDKAKSILTVTNSVIDGGGYFGFYLPGVVNATIDNSTVSGLSAIGIKAGTLAISGGTVKGTAATYTNVSAMTDGQNTNGSALIIESNTPPYAGGVKLTAEGVTFESTAGYGIDEVIKQNASTVIEVLDVSSSCTFKGVEGKTLIKEGVQTKTEASATE